MSEPSVIPPESIKKGTWSKVTVNATPIFDLYFGSEPSETGWPSPMSSGAGEDSDSSGDFGGDTVVLSPSLTETSHIAGTADTLNATDRPLPPTIREAAAPSEQASRLQIPGSLILNSNGELLPDLETHSAYSGPSAQPSNKDNCALIGWHITSVIETIADDNGLMQEMLDFDAPLCDAAISTDTTGSKIFLACDISQEDGKPQTIRHSSGVELQPERMIVWEKPSPDESDIYNVEYHNDSNGTLISDWVRLTVFDPEADGKRELSIWSIGPKGLMDPDKLTSVSAVESANEWLLDRTGAGCRTRFTPHDVELPSTAVETAKLDLLHFVPN